MKNPLVVAACVGILLLGMVLLKVCVWGRSVEKVELCETEDPTFDAAAECQRVINERFAGRECVFEFGPVEWLPFGSCRTCKITCA